MPSVSFRVNNISCRGDGEGRAAGVRTRTRRSRTARSAVHLGRRRPRLDSWHHPHERAEEREGAARISPRRSASCVSTRRRDSDFAPGGRVPSPQWSPPRRKKRFCEDLSRQIRHAPATTDAPFASRSRIAPRRARKRWTTITPCFPTTTTTSGPSRQPAPGDPRRRGEEPRWFQRMTLRWWGRRAARRSSAWLTVACPKDERMRLRIRVIGPLAVAAMRGRRGACAADPAARREGRGAARRKRGVFHVAAKRGQLKSPKNCARRGAVGCEDVCGREERPPGDVAVGASERVPLERRDAGLRRREATWRCCSMRQNGARGTRRRAGRQEKATWRCCSGRQNRCSDKNTWKRAQSNCRAYRSSTGARVSSTAAERRPLDARAG